MGVKMLARPTAANGRQSRPKERLLGELLSGGLACALHHAPNCGTAGQEEARYHGARSRQKGAAVFFAKSEKSSSPPREERGAFDPPCAAMTF